MTTNAPAPALDDGPQRGRLGYVVIGVVVAICAGGWAFIMANAGQTPGIQPQTLTFDVRSDSEVAVRWQVIKPKDKRVRCVVDAVDATFHPVAVKEVIVPAGVTTFAQTDVLQTSKRANSARVKDCDTL